MKSCSLQKSLLEFLEKLSNKIRKRFMEGTQSCLIEGAGQEGKRGNPRIPKARYSQKL